MEEARKIGALLLRQHKKHLDREGIVLKEGAIVQASVNDWSPVAMDRYWKKVKVQVRAKMEHPFLYIRKLFGHSKVRYRRLAKNRHWLFVSASFYNLIRCDQLLN